MNALKKKELAVPINLFAVIFFMTLFMCLALETQSENFQSRRLYGLLIIGWQLVFGFMALANVKRPAIFYLFSVFFILPLVVTCIVFSYLVMYPFLANFKAYAVAFMIIGAALNFYLSYIGYGSVFKATLDGNIASGRIDLSKGCFSFSVPPRMYEYKNPKMRAMSFYLMANMGLIAFIGPLIAFYVNRSPDINFKDISGGISTYLMGMVFVWAMSGSFYSHRWITAWEKSSGRIMVTKNI